MNHSFRFPPSFFKQLLASYDLSTKDAFVWGVSNESVAKAKYCSYGDAVVEDTGNMLHQHHFYLMIYLAVIFIQVLHKSLNTLAVGIHVLSIK